MSHYGTVNPVWYSNGFAKKKKNVNIGSGNGLVLSGNKPLPETIQGPFLSGWTEPSFTQSHVLEVNFCKLIWIMTASAFVRQQYWVIHSSTNLSILHKKLLSNWTWSQGCQQCVQLLQVNNKLQVLKIIIYLSFIPIKWQSGNYSLSTINKILLSNF